MDTDSNDIASNGFGNCLTRDGQGFASANLPMNSFRHTGVGNGVARTDYAALGQVEDGVINWAVAGGSADALTVTLSPAVTALVDGQLFFVRATASNATTTPTFSPNSLTAHTITKRGGAALVAGDIPGNLAECVLRYNLANTRYELLNPNSVSILDGTLTINAAAFWTALAANVDIGAAFDGGGSVLTAKNIFVHVPCAMTINTWSIMADQSGSVTIDILRANAGIPSASIVGGGTKPNLSSAQDSLDNAPASWTATTLAKDDWLKIEITGTPSSVTYLTFVLQCTRTGS
jgi:hypothetical protein